MIPHPLSRLVLFAALPATTSDVEHLGHGKPSRPMRASSLTMHLLSGSPQEAQLKQEAWAWGQCQDRPV